jgi:F-type H+-transporting ATPase subunit epsilon
MELNMTPFKLQIVTPDKVFFDGETDNLIVKTTVGDKGILARHEPYVAALVIGKFRVSTDGNFRAAAIASGILKVGKDRTTILAQSCEWEDEIDVNRAEIAKAKAEERLKQKLSAKESDMAEFKLKRALNRLTVAGRM